MYPSRQSAPHQLKRVSHHVGNTDSHALFNLLTSPQLFDQVEALLPKHRERLYPPTETLPLFLSQALSADGSCQQVVNDAMVKRVINGLEPGKTDTGAYCKARVCLPLSMISTLARHTGEIITSGAASWWHWRNRPVRLVDGATLNDGDVLLGDAYYATYFLLCELVQRGVDGLFEQYGARKRSTDFRKGTRLGERDHLIMLTKPKKKPDWMSQEDYDQAPNTLKVRELKAGGKIMVTTMLCSKEASKDTLKTLFRSRWNVELDLRNIKTTLGMEHLRCKTPGMAIKELWVYLLAYNLIRMLMAQAALLTDRIPRQLSFKHAVQTWVAWQQRGGGTHDAVAIEGLLILIAELQVGKRPGRVEPRALKRRQKQFPLLTQSRQDAREDVRENGHPKKQNYKFLQKLPHPLSMPAYRNLLQETSRSHYVAWGRCR